jgi:hypothetical protein
VSKNPMLSEGNKASVDGQSRAPYRSGTMGTSSRIAAGQIAQYWSIQ